MYEPSQLLQNFFTEKSRTGEQISQEESLWLEEMLTELTQTSLDVEDTQAIVFNSPDTNVFLAEPGERLEDLTIKSQYDVTDVLRKYKSCYSNQPRHEKRLLSQPQSQESPKIWTALPSHQVLTPVLQTFSSMHTTDKKEETKVKEVNDGPETITVTKTACTIMQILGEKEKFVERIQGNNFGKKIDEPAAAHHIVPETPQQQVKPFVADHPNDSELLPKRVKGSLEQKDDESLPVFEFDFVEQPQSPFESELKKLARAISSSQLPQFTF